MNKAALLYLLPIVISLVISVGVTFYSWRRRKVIGASAFVWFIVAEIIYTVGYIWELLSVPFERILFWNHFRYTISTIAPLLLLHFSLEFTRRKLQYPIRTWLLVSIPASAFLLLLITDSYHRLIHPSEILLRHVGPFSIIDNDFSLLSWVIIAYGFCMGLFSIALIIDRFINTKQLFRHQIITVLLGIGFPLVGVIIHLLEIKLAYQIDLSIIAFAIGNLVIAWGLFRLKLFDIVPIAHDRLIEQMHDAVFVLDTQYRFVDINLAALGYLDYPEAEIVGKQAADIMPHWDELLQHYQQSQGKSFDMTIDKSPGYSDVSVSVSDLADVRGNVAGQLIVLHDITEQKRTEREIKQYNQKLEILNYDLEEANAHLQRLDQIKDEFVANVSHELRTPLTNIKLFHELLALQPDRIEEFLETLERETDRLTTLIEDLLALTRFDQGIVQLHKSSFDLNVLLREFVEDRRKMAESKNLNLTVDTQQEMPMIYADRNLTGQVLSILLINAFNYTPASGRVCVTANISHHDDRDWAGFMVQDTGMGIPPDEQQNLFTRFYRGKVGRKSGISGTGLGLSIAKEIMDRQKGKISVKSVGIPGEGTTFQVWFEVEKS
jgi:PAS domain S-box-containing protein